MGVLTCPTGWRAPPTSSSPVIETLVAAPSARFTINVPVVTAVMGSLTAAVAPSFTVSGTLPKLTYPVGLSALFLYVRHESAPEADAPFVYQVIVIEKLLPGPTRPLPPLPIRTDR